MLLTLAVLCFILSNVNCNMKNNLIYDFINYKKPSTVVGFTCNGIEDDLGLLKELSKVGIAAHFNKLSKDSNVHVLLANPRFRKLGVILDIQCYEGEIIMSTFLKATDNLMFDEQRSWLILGQNLSDTLKIVNDRSFGVTTDFVIAVVSDDKTYKFYDVYNIFRKRGGKLNTTFLGEWNESEGLKVSLLQEKIRRRSNLHLIPLKATFLEQSYKPKDMPLIEYLKDFRNPTRDGVSKFGYHILQHFAEFNNFSLIVWQAGKWNPKDIGAHALDLKNNVVDFSGTPLTMSVKRAESLKYIIHAWPFRTCFIFRSPQPTNIKVQEILRPFINDIWCCIILFFIISTLIMYFILSSEYVENPITTCSSSFMMVTGALCQQGTELDIKQTSTRIAFISILGYGLLVYNFYSSCVVSARLDEPIVKIRDSLDEFSKLNLKMSSENMPYIEYFFRGTEESNRFYENYWLKLPEKQRVMAADVGMRLVQLGGFAYHTHPHVGYPYIDKNYNNREICELMEVHVAARRLNVMFAVTTNSTLGELTRVALTRIAEVGLRHRHVLRWSFKKPLCRNDVLSASSINIYEFAPHLILLMIGVGISIVSCVLEIAISRYYSSLNI